MGSDREGVKLIPGPTTSGRWRLAAVRSTCTMSGVFTFGTVSLTNGVVIGATCQFRASRVVIEDTNGFRCCRLTAS